jgi:UDP-glucose 4-epimerase
MNILLTGGAGYIGSHTAVHLMQAGHNICVLDNLCNSEKGVLERVAEIVGEAPMFVQADVRDTRAVADALNRHGSQAVIHFAGLKSVGESVSEPLRYYVNNVQGTLSLLGAMREAAVHTLVFSSSATVYGAPHYLPLDEEHPTGATNPYGRTKLHIEEILRDLAATTPAWSIACLRYFNPAGAHCSGLIGESPRGIPNNLMPYITQVACGLSPLLNVYGADYDTPDGTGVRDYIHVMDLAAGHLSALEFLQYQSGNHVFNLGTGRGYSVREVMRAFEAASGRAVPYHVAPRRAGDVASSYANPVKAQLALDWRAERSLEDMCKSAWRYQSRISKSTPGNQSFAHGISK